MSNKEKIEELDLGYKKELKRSMLEWEAIDNEDYLVSLKAEKHYNKLIKRKNKFKSNEIYKKIESKRIPIWTDSLRKQAKANREYEYVKEKLKTNPLFKLRKYISIRTSGALKYKGFSKTKNTESMIGCTYEFLRDHLAAQFTEGMTLENYGEWHIDHIIPLSLGKTKKEVEELAHYTNLQPLWAYDNSSKASKIVMSHISKDNRVRYKKFLNR